MKVQTAPVPGRQNEVVSHMRAAASDVAAAIAAVRPSNAAELVKLAFEFLVPATAPWGEIQRSTHRST